MSDNAAIGKSLADLIKKRMDDKKREGIRVYPCHANWASSLGHPCERMLVYKRTRWNDQIPLGVDVRYIFDEGNLHETAVNRDLMSAGLDIIGMQNSFYNDRLKISGKIDGFIHLTPEDMPGMVEKRMRVPYEIKAMSPFSIKNMQTVEQVMNNKMHYVRGYAVQMQLYLIENEEELGVWIFKDKVNGQFTIVPVTLDYEFCEEIYQKAERVNAAVEKYQTAKNEAGQEEALPKRIDYDQSICSRCAFRDLCQPDQALEGVEIILDETAADDLARWHELKPLVAEFKRIDESLKDKVEGKNAIVGDFYVTGKWVDRKGTPTSVVLAKPPSKHWKKKIEKLNYNEGKSDVIE